MEPIKNFSIFKVKEHNGDPKKPTHSISTKIGDKYEYVGSCWTKDANGQKFLSCSLNKPYNGKPGFSIEQDIDELDKAEHTESTTKYTGENGDNKEIPF